MMCALFFTSLKPRAFCMNFSYRLQPDPKLLHDNKYDTTCKILRDQHYMPANLSIVYVEFSRKSAWLIM